MEVGLLLQGPPLLDAVLIACPLEQSPLKLSLPKAPVIPRRKYQVTNTFYVRAGSPILTFNPAPPGDPPSSMWPRTESLCLL